MFKKLPIWLTAPALLLVVTLIVCVGGWLFWFNTRPVYNHDFWYSVTSEPPEFILYLFDPTPSNAVIALRDGLMNELARSGQLSRGYPKLIEASWEERTPHCNDENLLSGGRYFIQLSETSENYIELPLCPRISIGYSLVIHVLPAWPWAEGKPSEKIFIGMSQRSLAHERHDLKPGQEELILKSLENMGVKVYMDEHFQTLLKNRK